MSSGLPCVVADATGSRSLVESGVNGFLAAPRDTIEFARCVAKILEDESMQESMGKAARQKALAYSWENVNKKLLENYREALSEPRPQLKF
jgi:glycosyltransferase involved in cell wall biosynthesis